MNNKIKKSALRLLVLSMTFFIGSGVGVAFSQEIGGGDSPYFSATYLTFNNEAVIEAGVINGPPSPPLGFDIQRQSVSLPVPDQASGVQVLTVPAFNWVFGCSAVSGAMIAGYYDRNGYPNMYTGPTDGGVMPLNNSSWPTWSDGAATYPNCPLIASHDGVDGRVGRGSIDDYWVQYNSAADDPFITYSWTEHTWDDAIGDYMKTSQSTYLNNDGSSTFYNYTSSSQMTCTAMEGYSDRGFTLDTLDATYGRKLFYEARGYTVTDCYNQPTDNNYAGGFSFAQYQAEIDAGHPVMLNLQGHTVVGVGYDDSTSTVYLHDTWDYNTHTMTWGTSYSGMQLLSVSIVHLASVQDTDGDGLPDGTDPCPLTMPIRHVGGSDSAGGLQLVYDTSLQDLDTVQLQSLYTNPDPTITLDLAKSITIEGGHNCTYTDNSGEPTIIGMLTIDSASGAVTIDNISIE